MQKDLIKTHSLSEFVELLGDAPQYNGGLHVHLSPMELDQELFNAPFRIANYVFLLVVSGTIKMQLNLLNYTVCAGELITIMPQTVSQVLEKSTDVHVISVSFTSDFIVKNAFSKIEFTALDFFTSQHIMVLQLNWDEFSMAKTITTLLAENNSKDTVIFAFRDPILHHNFALLLYHYSGVYRRTSPAFVGDLSRKETLTAQFFKVLNEHFKKQRSVQFYADALFVTTSHLSKVLKVVSGKNTSQLIDEVVILEAKLLLRNPNFTIAQIADMLHFNHPSAFGKYFKKHTLHAPSFFRKTILS